MISRGRRAAAVTVMGALLFGVTGAPPARAAGTFDPQVTVTRTSDAARAATSLSLKITQSDDEDQIGKVALTLPRAPGFTVNTDVPGSNGAEIGTIRIVLFSDPGRTKVTINGTLADDNERAGCGPTSNPRRQCIIANLSVAGVQVRAQLEIYEDSAPLPSVYRITGDLTSTWADPNVQSINAHLAELSTTLYASVGGHTVIRNPDIAGTWPFAYDLKSTTNGTQPCAATSSCKIDLASVEYAPNAAAQQTPVDSAAVLSTSATPFRWAPSWDANGDSVSYQLLVDDIEQASGPATSASLSLAPGNHTWKVVATDSTGRSTTSLTRALTVVDPSLAQVFTGLNGDKLYVVPGAFVYVISGSTALGTATASATPDRGSIVANGSGFTLVVAYDAATGTAAGALNFGSVRRGFVDPPLV